MEEIIHQTDEPDWNINEEIKKAVYTNMPKELEPEEIALYVYERMCQIFSFDEGYVYRKKLNNPNYNSVFSKEHLEGITVNSKVTCLDFSRIYMKLINELNDNLEAVMINQCNSHYYVMFFTDKCSAKLEATKNFIAKGKNRSTNDIERAKTGEELKGVKIVLDKEGLIPKAMEKVNSLIKKDKLQKISYYVQQLMEEPTKKEKLKENLEIYTEECLKIILKNMKKENITGNEFTINFVNRLNEYVSAGIFGKNVRKTFLGRLETNKNGEKRYKRYILIKDEREFYPEKMQIFLIDTDELIVSKCSDKELRMKLKDKEFIYENEKRKMPGFDRE